MEDWSARQYLKFEDERTRPPRDLSRRCRCSGRGWWSISAAGRAIPPNFSSNVSRVGSHGARTRRPTCCARRANACRNANSSRPISPTWVAKSGNRSHFRQCGHAMAAGSSCDHAANAHGMPQGGVLAIQMPDNTREPALVFSARSARAGRGRIIRRSRPPRGIDLPSPEGYYDLLKPACSHIDIWHTVYNHVMASPQAITEWFKGSSLQPFLSPLDVAGPGKIPRRLYGEDRRRL